MPLQANRQVLKIKQLRAFDGAELFICCYTSFAAELLRYSEGDIPNSSLNLRLK